MSRGKIAIFKHRLSAAEIKDNALYTAMPAAGRTSSLLNSFSRWGKKVE